MIIGKNSNILVVADFKDFLQEVANKVVIVKGKTQSTGWMITDELIITLAMDPLISENINYYKPGLLKKGEWRRISIENVIIGLPDDMQVTDQIVLLRVPKIKKFLAPRLKLGKLEEGDQIFTFQYINDEKLQFSVGKLTSTDDNYFYHDCDTLPGSMGGPVINSSGEIAGIHVGGTGTKSNEGIPFRSYSMD